MICHIQHSGSVCYAIITDDNLVVVCKFEINCSHDLTWELVVAIRGGDLKCYRLRCCFYLVINLILPTCVTAMQTSHTVVVLGQYHLLTVVGVLTIVDAVCIATHRTTEIRFEVPWEIVFNLVETAGNIY